MRKEPFGVGSIVHVYNRGNRKQEIVRDDKDRWHFLQMLYYFNSDVSVDNPFRTLKELLKSDFNTRLVWPNSWPVKNNLVNIIAFCLRDNHFHLILEEIQEGGVTKFMRKFGTSMTNYFNTKYKENGRLFQGAYKARLVDRDNYLKYLSVYVEVKNVLEKYPGGVEGALRNFDDAFEYASRHAYSSLGSRVSKFSENSKIVNNQILQDLFNPDEFKVFSKSCLSFISFNEVKSRLELPLKSDFNG